MIAKDDNKLDDLERCYLGWRIWLGQVTRQVWAMPPPGHPHHGLVSAEDADALAAKLAQITSWDGGVQRSGPAHASAGQAGRGSSGKGGDRVT